MPSGDTPASSGKKLREVERRQVMGGAGVIIKTEVPGV
jgi:hypothetical protein